MKIGIVIQARMGSSRLKNKILEKIGSKEIILFLFERLKTVEGVSEIILATSENEEENPLVSFANKIAALAEEEDHQTLGEVRQDLFQARS